MGRIAVAPSSPCDLTLSSGRGLPARQVRQVQSWVLAFIALNCLMLGCSRGLPLVKPPQVDADQAAAGSLKQFDTNGDQQISRDEAKACAGILGQWKRYDTDDNGTISSDELKARFERWSNSDTGLMNLRVQLQYRQQPLANAQVRLIPYEFLGDQFLPAEGETDQYGYAFMAIPKNLLPASQQGTFGMQLGLYRAEITHPSIAIPVKYNEQSQLSVDLSSDEANTGVSFELTP